MAALTGKGVQGMLPREYQETAEKLRKTFSDRQAWAIARMLHELDLGAGEVTAAEILQNEGGFSEKQAKTLVRLYATLRKIANAA